MCYMHGVCSGVCVGCARGWRGTYAVVLGCFRVDFIPACHSCASSAWLAPSSVVSRAPEDLAPKLCCISFIAKLASRNMWVIHHSDVWTRLRWLKRDYGGLTVQFGVSIAKEQLKNMVVCNNSPNYYYFGGKPWLAFQAAAQAKGIV